MRTHQSLQMGDVSEANVLGHRLAVEVVGTGSPAVFVHGIGSNRKTWSALVGELKSRLTCFTIDLPGVGDSFAPPEFDYSLESLAQVLRSFILNEDLRDITLFAHSFGAGIAFLSLIQADSSFLERISRLCILDGMCYPQRFPLFVAALRTPLLSRALTELLPSSLQARSVLQQCYFDQSKITPAQVDVYARMLDRQETRDAIRRMAREIDPNHLSKYLLSLKSINIPTLLIWGDNDRIVPLENGERLNRDLCNSELHVIDTCGHMPQEECPQATVNVITRFLERMNTGSSSHDRPMA